VNELCESKKFINLTVHLVIFSNSYINYIFKKNLKCALTLFRIILANFSTVAPVYAGITKDRIFFFRCWKVPFLTGAESRGPSELRIIRAKKF